MYPCDIFGMHTLQACRLKLKPSHVRVWGGGKGGRGGAVTRRGREMRLVVCAHDSVERLVSNITSSSAIHQAISLPCNEWHNVGRPWK